MNEGRKEDAAVRRRRLTKAYLWGNKGIVSQMEAFGGVGGEGGIDKGGINFKEM